RSPATLAPALSISACFLLVTPPRELSTLSLHDALPICLLDRLPRLLDGVDLLQDLALALLDPILRDLLVREDHELADGPLVVAEDRKSTRLNSSHVKSSYAVFCLKKKNDNAHKVEPVHL